MAGTRYFCGYSPTTAGEDMFDDLSPNIVVLTGQCANKRGLGEVRAQNKR